MILPYCTDIPNCKIVPTCTIGSNCVAVPISMRLFHCQQIKNLDGPDILAKNTGAVMPATNSSDPDEPGVHVDLFWANAMAVAAAASTQLTQIPLGKQGTVGLAKLLVDITYR